MSEDEFKKQFRQRKEQRKNTSQGSAESASSLISNYQTAIRDPNTIEAWRQCMLSRTSDPAIVSYGYRDGSDNAYVSVMWLPGRSLAAIAPEVAVRFVSPDPDVIVDAQQGRGTLSRLLGSDTVRLASGSGAVFALRFKNPTGRARYQSFAILVNATANDGRRHLMDFHEQAIIPPANGEAPCDLLIKAGRVYKFDTSMPMMPAEVNAFTEGLFDLRVQAALPGSATSGREYNAQLSVSSAGMAKFMSYAPAAGTPARESFERTLAKLMQTHTAWIRTEGATLKLRIDNKSSVPAKTGDGRCTVTTAEGGFPGTPATRFTLNAKP